MCCFCPPPFKQFLEAVTNMKFDEEPNYSKLISFFESLIEPCTPLRPIRIDGALKVIAILTVRTHTHTCTHKFVHNNVRLHILFLTYFLMSFIYIGWAKAGSIAYKFGRR